MFGIAGFPGDLLAENKNIDHHHQVSSSKLTHETHTETQHKLVGVRYGKEWRKSQIRRITDRVFDQVMNPEQNNLRFGDLYIAILLVYNDINKYIPGPHFDPPSKDRIRQVIKFCDYNEDGQINREEFFDFFEQMAPETFNVVRRKLVATLVAAPTVAVATKKATERVPVVGKLVQWLPKAVYAFLMTIAAVWYQDGSAH